jgi:hypothetical protein
MKAWQQALRSLFAYMIWPFVLFRSNRASYFSLAMSRTPVFNLYIRQLTKDVVLKARKNNLDLPM